MNRESHDVQENLKKHIIISYLETHMRIATGLAIFIHRIFCFIDFWLNEFSSILIAMKSTVNFLNIRYEF